MISLNNLVIKNWIESELLSPDTHLNRIKKNSNENSYVCYLFNDDNQNELYITDTSIRLKTTINQKRLLKLRHLIFNNNNSRNNQIKLVKIFLKQYLYSSMINFKVSNNKNKDPYVFMIIDDFELISDKPFICSKSEIFNLPIGNHSSLIKTTNLIKQTNTKQQSIASQIAKPETNEDKNEDNLSLLIKNLSPLQQVNKLLEDTSTQYSDYTIDLIKENDLKENLKNNQIKINSNNQNNRIDLNEAFFKNDISTTVTQLSTISSNNESNNLTTVSLPCISSQLVKTPDKPVFDCSSILSVTKSSIKITKINNTSTNMTEEEKEENDDTSSFIITTKNNIIKDTQNQDIQMTNQITSSIKKKRKLMNEKISTELINNDVSLLSDESSSSRSSRVYSSSSTTSSSSSSLSLTSSSSCSKQKNQPFKSADIFKSKICKDIFSFFNKEKLDRIKKNPHSNRAHLIFSPIKKNPLNRIRAESPASTGKILKQLSLNSSPNVNNNRLNMSLSPAKLNSDLLDKIVKLGDESSVNKLVSSDDEHGDDTDNSLIRSKNLRRRRLLFDKNAIDVEKTFATEDNELSANKSRDKSIPCGQNFNKADSTINQSVQMSLLNFKFMNSSTADSLQEYLNNLKKCAKN